MDGTMEGEIVGSIDFVQIGNMVGETIMGRRVGL